MSQQDDNPFPVKEFMILCMIIPMLIIMVCVMNSLVTALVERSAREYAAQEIPPQDYLVVKAWQQEYPTGPVHDLIVKSFEDKVVTRGEFAEINKTAGLDIKERINK